jgi:Flp pilus assembly protein TadD
MPRSVRFWISMTVFQVVFGLAVFSITRQYYISGSTSVGPATTVASQPLPVWEDPFAAGSLPEAGAPAVNPSAAADPMEMSRQADEFFANQQYGSAAELYSRLLALDPRNVELYNNLGITLHYLGRSTEALGRLNEGVTVDPTHQRIWLTLGFVNSQVGNIEQARIALATAVQIEPGNEIGQSAASMLEALP